MSHLLQTTTRALAFATLIATSALASPAAQAAQPAGVTRTDLQRHHLSGHGPEAGKVRVDIAPGVAFPNHTHPGEEIIYVLAGSMEYDAAGKAPAILKAGDVLFIPAGTVHSAKNVGDVTAS